jgi:hypothetical protein
MSSHQGAQVGIRGVVDIGHLNNEIFDQNMTKTIFCSRTEL